MARRPKRKFKKRKKKVSEKNQELVFKTRSDWIKKALIGKKQYDRKYNESLKHNDDFWKKEGKRITWIKPYKKIKNVKYSKTDVHIKWYYDGTLNASANCIDRHLKDKKNKELRHLPLIKQSRLSVMPIDTKSWKVLNKMSNIDKKLKNYG